jgi:ketosteroid isomerase-like protein
VSEENVQTLRRLLELWDQGITDVPTDLVAPDIELASPLTNFRGRPYRGYDDAREWLRDINEQFETWAYTISEWRDLGTGVLALGRLRLEGRGSGLVLDQELAWLARFSADGRISRIQVFADRGAALEAAAVAE